MAEVKSSFAVQIKAWHARAAGRRQVAKALGLDAITEALVGLTPELDRFCDEPAARKSIEMSSMATSFTATTRAILQQPPPTQKGTTSILKHKLASFITEHGDQKHPVVSSTRQGAHSKSGLWTSSRHLVCTKLCRRRLY